MMRVLAVAFLALALMTPGAAAQGKPQAGAAETEIVSVNETRWIGETQWSDGERTVWTSAHFRADGVLVYEYNGTSYDNGRWRQRDRLVSFDTNDHYALFMGHVSGGRIEGVMFNKEGLRGEFWFSRQ